MKGRDPAPLVPSPKSPPYKNKRDITSPQEGTGSGMVGGRGGPWSCISAPSCITRISLLFILLPCVPSPILTNPGTSREQSNLESHIVFEWNPRSQEYPSSPWSQVKNTNIAYHRVGYHCKHLDVGLSSLKYHTKNWTTHTTTPEPNVPIYKASGSSYSSNLSICYFHDREISTPRFV